MYFYTLGAINRFQNFRDEPNAITRRWALFISTLL